MGNAVDKFLESYKSILQVRKRVIVIAAGMSLAISALLQQTGTFESLENRIGRPVLFRIREHLDLAPKLNSRLVIYAYNDEAINEWGRPETLTGGQWREILKAIADHDPAAILVDMIFARRRNDPSDVMAMNKAFKQKMPVFTAAAVLPNTLKRFTPFAMDGTKFQASASDLDFLKKYRQANSGQTILGPADNLRQLHHDVGHINFRAPGFFMPIVPFPPDKRLKHLALAYLPESSVKISDTGLAVDGSPLHINSNGEALINWGSRKDYAQNTFKIIDLVEMRRRGKLSTLIKPDSIVLFLPLMFTGNADFKETFVGELVGGYVQAAIINSTLTGDWLGHVQLSYLGIMIALVIAISGMILRRNFQMVAFAAASNLVAFTGIVAAFLSTGWLIDWLTPAITFNLALLPVIISCVVSDEVKSMRMQSALAGVLSPKMLQQIAKSPTTFSLQPVEQTVTVMFVDFAGFSAVAERMQSRFVFESLRKHFAEIGKIIHKHHGLVDKSLGDGLLGVFGFDPVTREISNTHAEDAIRCAIELQRLIADDCADYNQSTEPGESVIFAARVGLNTGPVYIGNIGEEGRLDLTVIGHTVNMGKRFEDACEPLKVMLGENTRKYLPVELRSQLCKRDIQIKHQKDLIEAWEFDPFKSNERLYLNALSGFRKFSNISRIADRIPIPANQTWIILQNGKKTGRAVDYSTGGLCLELDTFYGNKVKLVVDVIITTADGKTLHEAHELVTTVKWGAPSSTGYRHGVAFTEESSKRFRSIFDSLGNQ